ncbi:FAS1-like dehydratase domain-containing protein [Microvirga makkahensis]|uniref:Protein dehydratase n=1 Tax=Microvirga makkahensis TaxID=1128670 RepID=A0A7X3MPG2_9HYPH|nr:MaoC family dehydratase N-terminal domain-containing protein [Microvirga makkahensis]MXQ10762.1 protein dehydratase [Microvirga makkahensis]
MSLELDINHLKGWIGTVRVSEDIITPRLANSLAAILDEPCNLKAGDPAPVGAHWCLSPDIAPMSGLGPDGHPARGGFLPPVPLPRRMWAGGELRFSGEFYVGDEVKRISRISDVAMKTGRTGTLCFVAVDHEYYTGAGLVLQERHDIVYRALEVPTGGQPPKVELPEPDLTLAVEGTPVLLARYSAVTFNGHRIHYDREYCITEEFYPGLIVHGPLQANFLLRMARQMNGNAFPARFKFRGTSPLFDGSVFTVNGKAEGEGFRLWVADTDGVMTMQASAE